uniref:Uncharacterized protein n=2 Tax=viral metagenome TaxID=1070528 RepID=A0A6H1ZQJ3_9ZZZZ
MAWTAPRTWVVGELVTAAIMNTYIRDNQDYIKTEIDKLDDVSYVDQTGARALNTNYQNGTKIRFMNVTLTNNLNDTNGYDAYGYVKSTSPADNEVCRHTAVNGSGIVYGMAISIFLIVPPLWYYRVTGVGDDTPTLLDWHEFDAH